MADYGKITTTGSIQKQGNPVSATTANPTERQKEIYAELRGELELVYSQTPEYDIETEYVQDHWEEVDGKAVQVWEIKEKEPEEVNTNE